MLIEHTQLLRNGELKSRRLALGMRQKDIADKCGISIAAISHIEAFRERNTDAASVRKVAKFFGISAEELVPRWLADIEAIPVKVTVEANVGKNDLERLARSAQHSLASSGRVVEQFAIANEEAARLVKSFETLPIQFQEALRLYSEGYSHGEIAKKTGLSKTRVYQIVNQGVLHFMRMLPEAREYNREEIFGLLAYGIHGGSEKTLLTKDDKPPRRMSSASRSKVKIPMHIGGAKAGDMVRLNEDGRPKIFRTQIKMVTKRKRGPGRKYDAPILAILREAGKPLMEEEIRTRLNEGAPKHRNSLCSVLKRIPLVKSKQVGYKNFYWLE